MGIWIAFGCSIQLNHIITIDNSKMELPPRHMFYLYIFDKKNWIINEKRVENNLREKGWTHERTHTFIHIWYICVWFSLKSTQLRIIDLRWVPYWIQTAFCNCASINPIFSMLKQDRFLYFFLFLTNNNSL